MNNHGREKTINPDKKVPAPWYYDSSVCRDHTRGTLLEETIEIHREIADAIAAHDPLRAQDAMYLHLVYNRKRIQMTGKGDLK